MDWIVADAVRLFRRATIYAAGVGAIYLKNNQPAAVELAAITDSFTFTQKQSYLAAAKLMESQLPAGGIKELLCVSAGSHSTQVDRPGQPLAPKAIVGESFVASAAWQCVAACDAISCGKFTAANVSVVGANQQAVGARFERNDLI
jgi:hypothetical protein